MKNNLSIKTIVAIGIGSAVFMILARFAAIPTPIPNTTFNTAYGFLALMAVIFGPIAGVSIGFIGHTLTDLTAYGSPWFSWIVASAIVGLVIGFSANRLKINEGEFGKKEMIIFNIY
ncbi:ECF-type riboflavin transporter substrate-binding protein, partial [Clostridium saudiense]|nr:ECF-type riboflavin transporter substrate-binding protein [Clostridium saudiense]